MVQRPEFTIDMEKGGLSIIRQPHGIKNVTSFDVSAINESSDIQMRPLEFKREKWIM